MLHNPTRLIKALSLILLFTLVLLGCTHVSTKGSKRENTSMPITRVLVQIDDTNRFGDRVSTTRTINGVVTGTATGTSPAVANLLNEMLSAIVSALSARTPLVFKANQISSQVLLSSQVQSVNSPKTSDFSHMLTFTPSVANFGSNAAKGVRFNTNFIEISTRKTIWTGTSYFGHSVLGSVNDQSADEFLKTVLSDLNKQDVIKLNTAEPVLP